MPGFLANSYVDIEVNEHADGTAFFVIESLFTGISELPIQNNTKKWTKDRRSFEQCVMLCRLSSKSVIKPWHPEICIRIGHSSISAQCPSQRTPCPTCDGFSIKHLETVLLHFLQLLRTSVLSRCFMTKV